MLEQQFYTTTRHCIRSTVVGVGHGVTDRAASSLNLVPLCPPPIRYGIRVRLGEVVLHFGSTLAARGVLMDIDFGKLVPEYLKRSDHLKNQWRIDIGVPIVENLVELWLGLPSWNKFPLLQKVVQSMSVSSTRSCYRNNFVDDNFSTIWYNVMVGVVNAVRSYFGQRGLLSSCLLDYGKTIGLLEAM